MIHNSRQHKLKRRDKVVGGGWGGRLEEEAVTGACQCHPRRHSQPTGGEGEGLRGLVGVELF